MRSAYPAGISCLYPERHLEESALSRVASRRKGNALIHRFPNQIHALLPGIRIGGIWHQPAENRTKRCSKAEWFSKNSEQHLVRSLRQMLFFGHIAPANTLPMVFAGCCGNMSAGAQRVHRLNVHTTLRRRRFEGVSKVC